MTRNSVYRIIAGLLWVAAVVVFVYAMQLIHQPVK